MIRTELEIRRRQGQFETAVWFTLRRRLSHSRSRPKATRARAKCSLARTRTRAWPARSNQFATGIGNTDAGFVMGTGKLLIKVPETMRFRLEGRLQPGVMAKDVILHCIGEIGSTARRIARCNLTARERHRFRWTIA